MSIEAAVEALAKAISENTAAIQAQTAAVTKVLASVANPANVQDVKAEGNVKAGAKAQSASPSTTAEKPKPAAKAADTAAPEKVVAPAESAASSSPKDEPSLIDFDKAIRPKFLKMIQTMGPDSAASVIAHFSKTATRITEACPPERYPELLALIDSKMAEASI